MSKSLTVLVRDCDLTSFYIVQKYFEFCNTNALLAHATTASEGLRYCIQNQAPDLLIIDPYMPVMGARAFLAKMHEQ